MTPEFVIFHTVRFAVVDSELREDVRTRHGAQLF